MMLPVETVKLDPVIPPPITVPDTLILLPVITPPTTDAPVIVPVTETVVPDYVTLTYSCNIQTYYVEQMNKIIEAINYASDSYWGDMERFKFKASIDSYSTIIEMTDSTNRIVKGTFTIKLFGYIVPDTIQKEITALKKYNSKAQIIIGTETTNNLKNI